MIQPEEKPAIPWYGSPRALLRALMQLEDTPHSIALGAAIGMGIALTPTPGLQMAIVMLTAFVTAPLFRFNRIAALVMVYVSNPLTAAPLAWAWYKVGTLFITGDLSYSELRQIMTPSADYGVLDMVYRLGVEIGWPMLIGSAIVATVSAVVTYPCVFWLVQFVQRRGELTSRSESTDRTTSARKPGTPRELATAGAGHSRGGSPC